MTGRGLTGRAWLGIGVGLAAVVVLAAWFVLIGPTRSDASELRQSAADVETQNNVLRAKVTTLARQAEDRKSLSKELESALGGLPPGTNLPAFNRQLADQATKRGVALTGFSVGAPTVPGAAAAGATDQTTASAPLLAIPVTVVSTGPALAELYFLRDIQQVGPRLALVSSTSLAPGQGAGEDGSIEDDATLTVQLTVFTHRLAKETRDQLAGLAGDPASN